LAKQGFSELQAEVTDVEQAQENWVARAGRLPRNLFVGAIAQVKKRYAALKNRYGPRYTNAMLSTAFVAFILPIPGSSLAGVFLVVAIAEVHRTISRRAG
jgi:NAD(P)H-nitrite reductase large subunit